MHIRRTTLTTCLLSAILTSSCVTEPTAIFPPGDIVILVRISSNAPGAVVSTMDGKNVGICPFQFGLVGRDSTDDDAQGFHLNSRYAKMVEWEQHGTFYLVGKVSAPGYFTESFREYVPYPPSTGDKIMTLSVYLQPLSTAPSVSQQAPPSAQ